MTRTMILGHRGASGEAPENTLRAFALAAEQGADGVELDVHATRDGVVVVHHDPALADGAGIAQLDWATLRSVDLGGGDRVPALAEVLDAVGGRGVVYVEIKGRGIERAVVDRLRNAPQTAAAVHSFDHRAARVVRSLAPSVPVGVLLASYLVDPAAVLRDTGARDWWQQWEQIDERLVETVHAAGGRVVAWTANDLDACARMVAMGVDALCGDMPGALRSRFPASPRTDR